MHQHGSKYFVSRPLPLTLRVKRSEQCHVAYQIKGNHEFSSMVANIVPVVQTSPKGGVLNFFRIPRLGPCIYRSPQKLSGISSTPKKYLKFSNQKKSQFCTLTLKKYPKMHRNDPQTSPIL